jgi:hypothetical protein
VAGAVREVRAEPRASITARAASSPRRRARAPVGRARAQQRERRVAASRIAPQTSSARGDGAPSTPIHVWSA